MPRRRTSRSPRGSTARRSAARRSTPAAGGPTGSARWSTKIAELAGTGVEPEIQGAGNPAGEIDRQYVDPSKIRELCGWQPAVALDQGLARAIEWYRERPEARPPV